MLLRSAMGRAGASLYVRGCLEKWLSDVNPLNPVEFSLLIQWERSRRSSSLPIDIHYSNHSLVFASFFLLTPKAASLNKEKLTDHKLCCCSDDYANEKTSSLSDVHKVIMTTLDSTIHEEFFNYKCGKWSRRAWVIKRPAIWSMWSHGKAEKTIKAPKMIYSVSCLRFSFTWAKPRHRRKL